MKNKGLRFKTLQSRLVFFIGLGLILVGASIILFNGILARNTAINSASENALQSAQKTSYQVKAELENGMLASRALAYVFSGIEDRENPLIIDRDQANTMLRKVLENNPDFLGISTGWEPNAFDGKDADFVNTDAHDSSGRFIPYWVRDSKGAISHVALVDYEKEGAGEYYLCPKRTGKECILNPYLYEIDGKNVLLTSAMVPVMNNGTFYGVVGVDTALTSLQTMAEQINLYEGSAEFILVSNDGTVVAAGKHPDAIGKPLSELGIPGLENEMEAIQSGSEHVDNSGSSLVAFTTFVIGKTPSPWAGILIIPTEVLTRSAMQAVYLSSLIGIGLIILGLIAMWFIIGQAVSKPITTLVKGAKRIALGDSAVTGVNRNDINTILARPDEIGAIGNAFTEITGYQKEMAEIAGQIAAGDLTGRISPKDEMDMLGHAFVTMGDSLRAALNDVAASSDSVNNASNQLAATAQQAGQATSQIAMTIQQVAAGTTQQAGSISKTAGSVEQMTNAINGVAKGAQDQASYITNAVTLTNHLSDQILKVAGNADEVVRGSNDAAYAARDGAKIVEDTLKGMNNIKAKVDVSAQKVQEMGSRSEQIGEIITTIEDIASQTNLLALNAAIEAARAGDAGKGFAVVADEVRKLAERSSSATREIGDLITGIQTTVSQAVTAMQEGSNEVDMGVIKAGQAGDALTSILEAAETVKTQAEQAAEATTLMSKSANELVAAVDSVSVVVEENTAATEQMSASSTEVSQAIENIASISEENSAAVEEVSASTEEMSAQVEEVSASATELADQAKKLKEVVTRFRL